MGLSSIQISIEFKQTLKEEKEKGESYEDYIKRLRKKSIEKKEQSIDLIEQDPYASPILIKDNSGRDWKFPNPPLGIRN